MLMNIHPGSQVIFSSNCTINRRISQLKGTHCQPLLDTEPDGNHSDPVSSGRRSCANVAFGVRRAHLRSFSLSNIEERNVTE